MASQGSGGACRALDADQAAGKDSEMDQFFATYDARNLQLIQKATQRQRTKRLLKRTLPRMVRIAALWIAVLAIGGGIAMAASPTARVYLVKLLMETTPPIHPPAACGRRRKLCGCTSGMAGNILSDADSSGLVLSEQLDDTVVYSYPDHPMWQFAFSELDEGQRSRSTRRTRKSAR